MCIIWPEYLSANHGILCSMGDQSDHIMRWQCGFSPYRDMVAITPGNSVLYVSRVPDVCTLVQHFPPQRSRIKQTGSFICDFTAIQSGARGRHGISTPTTHREVNPGQRSSERSVLGYFYTAVATIVKVKVVSIVDRNMKPMIAWRQ